MPRAKSELTGVRPRHAASTPAGDIRIRWSEAHHIKYLQLGGSKWLREQVEKHMEKRK